VEEYRLDDADYALVTIGSMTGAAKDAVDSARERGEKVGLIKIKTFRPFPVQAMTQALSKVKAVGVVDRSVHYGWNCGPLYQEVLGCLYHSGNPIASMTMIGGLAGADLTEGHFKRAIEDTAKLKAGFEFDGPIWLNEND
jgi:pyruvate ferredoxin oxidoreductase alpha subunit/phenylglyoxylate dehydrogenase alpha subunit